VLEVVEGGRKIEGRWLWQGLCLKLSGGTILGLVGASGTGKTQLLRAIAGLDSLDQGMIKYRDIPLSGWSLPEYRSQVIYLHQRPTMFEGTVEDNLRAVYQWEVHRQKRYNRDFTLALLDLWQRPLEFLQKSALQLSGGEAQMVALIRALQLEPMVLLLDECSASLDQETTLRLESAIALWLEQNNQRACIWTSHDPNQIERVTNQQLLLSAHG